QYGEVGLVRESLRDREALLRCRPHLVRPIELLIPLRAGDPVPPWKLEVGLFLYDRLAVESRLPRHRRLSRQETLQREPDLAAAAGGAARAGAGWDQGQSPGAAPRRGRAAGTGLCGGEERRAALLYSAMARTAPDRNDRHAI